MCLTLLGTCAKGVQFYCPSRTYQAITYCTVLPVLARISQNFFFTDFGHQKIIYGAIDTYTYNGNSALKTLSRDVIFCLGCDGTVF